MRYLRPRWLLLYLFVLLAAAAGTVLLEKERLAGDFLAEGRALVSQGRHRTALTDFTLAILLTPSDPEPYEARARAFQALTMPGEAVADLEAAIALAPERAELHFLHGLLLAGPLDDSRAAVRAFDAVLRLESQRAEAYYQRGLAYDRINNPHQAIKDFTQALALRPEMVEARLARAGIHARFRDGPRQIADLTAALRLRPDDTELYRLRGEAYLAQRRFAEAKLDLDRVLREAPSAPAYFKRGTAQLNLERYRAAVADFTRVLKLHRYSIAAYYNRARAYAALGEHERARRDWAAVCEMQTAGQSEACLLARRDR